MILPPTGLSHSVYHIPGNLLNSGFHHFGWQLVMGRLATTYRLDQATRFGVVDTRKWKLAWFVMEPGGLKPLLPWTMEYLGE